MVMRLFSRAAVRAASVGTACAVPQLLQERKCAPHVFCEERRLHPKFDYDWDRRHPSDASVACQGKSRVILFIRHGQYETRGGPGYGRLTDVGREQAKLAGQHIVARMQADPVLKKSMLRLTSSALDRAIETADIIEREIVDELAWVDVELKQLPTDAKVKLMRTLDDNLDVFSIEYLPSPVDVVDKDNLLQPQVQLQTGSEIRIMRSSSTAAARNQPLAPLATVLEDAVRVSVHQPLSSVKRLDNRFEEWKCSGCKVVSPPGAVHWSDHAETNGLGFCDACFRAGPQHKKLEPHDRCSRTTEGTPQSPFRMPHDKNLNEADVDICSILTPDDALYEDYGWLNSQILKDHAAVDAAFYAHMHRSVDHKRLTRADRIDTIPFIFVSATGKEEHRRWTASEFKKLKFEESGVCPWILDSEAKETVPGPFTLKTLGEEDVTGCSAAEVQAKVAQRAAAAQPRKKQVEIYVVHQNIIRYMFLKLMQFDTTAWLNFGGSNCTMTQLRLTPRGDVICDFFGDHGSKLPVSHYTFNKHPDV